MTRRELLLAAIAAPFLRKMPTQGIIVSPTANNIVTNCTIHDLTSNWIIYPTVTSTNHIEAVRIYRDYGAGRD